MHEIFIPDNQKYLYMPECLAECNGEQFIVASDLIYKYISGKMYYEVFRVQMVYALLGMKPKESKNPDDQEDKEANIYQLSELIDSFFEGDKEHKTIKLDIWDNPLPTYRPLYRKYAGPESGFNDLTWGEYSDALRYFYEYGENPDDEELLYIIAAILYRPVTLLSGKREPYIFDSLKKRVEIFKKYPIGFAYGVYLLFASFNQRLATSEIPWGGNVIDVSILFDGSNQVDLLPGIGMDAVSFALAENGTFGNLESLRESSFWIVLMKLYDLRKKEIEEKAKNKSNGTN